MNEQIYTTTMMFRLKEKTDTDCKPSLFMFKVESRYYEQLICCMVHNYSKIYIPAVCHLRLQKNV